MNLIVKFDQLILSWIFQQVIPLDINKWKSKEKTTHV